MDGHDRGVRVLARLLRDAGMEVVYLGKFLPHEAVIEAAIQENAQVVGLSFLSGEHVPHTRRFAGALRNRGLTDVLFLFGEEVVTYRGYDERTDWLAGGLARLGLGRGDRMAVLLPNGLPIVEAYMGAAKLRVVSVPLNPLFTPREIEYVVNNSRAKVLVASPRDAERVQAIRDRMPSLAHGVVAGGAGAGPLPY